MTVKLTKMQIENVKKVITVDFNITENGLTLIGGKNKQGKTTILDAIAFALGGKKYQPSNLKREGSHADPYMKLTLNNGLVVERKGKNATLKVSDPSGAKRGQAILDSFVEEFALNIPKFMQLSNDKKVAELLNIIGVEDELDAIDKEEQIALDKRYNLKQDLQRKKSHAAELDYYEDAPDHLIDASELIKQSGEILKRNEEKQQLKNKVSELETADDNAKRELKLAEQELERIQEAVKRCKNNAIKAASDLLTAKENSKDIEMESTEELQNKLDNIDNINAKVRSNMDKDKADDEAKQCEVEVKQAEDELAAIRMKRTALLDNANLPLPELSIGKDSNGKPVITYNNLEWDCMSGMEQMMVSAAIVKSLKPECGFILLDGLEAFDSENLKVLIEWLKQENLQAIGTCVGDNSDCSIIIEEGEVKEVKEVKTEKVESWV